MRIMVPVSEIREAVLKASRKYYAHRAYYGDLLSRRPEAVKATNRELEFLEKVFQRESGRPVRDVLDVACGGGRHVVGLAGRGYRCTGQDYTLERVQIARSRAKREKVAVKLLQGDAVKLSYREQFDAVLALNILFLLPSDDDVEETLRRAHRALRVGGVLVCNIFNPYYSEKGEFSDVLYRGIWTGETRAPGILNLGITRLEDLDRVHGVAWFGETSIIEADDGTHVFRDRERVRFFTYWDLSRYLRDAGFREIKCYPDMKIKPPRRPKGEELVFVAQK
jgi:SAM-dependent methyltransferase